MAENRGVAYMEPGEGRGPRHRLSDVRTEGRARGQPGQRRSQDCPTQRSSGAWRRTSAARISTWSAAGRRRPSGLILGHEITGEVIETGPGVEFIKEGDLVLGAVQHRMRALPHVQDRQHRGVPERQPRPTRLGVRLRRHGRLGRRPGRVRHGPLRGLEPAQVPRQGAGDGEDPRPDDAVGHLPDRLPRRVHRRRHLGLDRLRRGRADRSGWQPRTRRSCSALRW